MESLGTVPGASGWSHKDIANTRPTPHKILRCQAAGEDRLRHPLRRLLIVPRPTAAELWRARQARAGSGEQAGRSHPAHPEAGSRRFDPILSSRLASGSDRRCYARIVKWQFWEACANPGFNQCCIGLRNLRGRADRGFSGETRNIRLSLAGRLESKSQRRPYLSLDSSRQLHQRVFPQ